jgi:hypothetical protein
MRKHTGVDGGEDAGGESEGGESERCRVSNLWEDEARRICGLRHMEADSCSGLVSDAATIVHGHVCVGEICEATVWKRKQRPAPINGSGIFGGVAECISYRR